MPRKKADSDEAPKFVKPKKSVLDATLEKAGVDVAAFKSDLKALGDGKVKPHRNKLQAVANKHLGQRFGRAFAEALIKEWS